MTAEVEYLQSLLAWAVGLIGAMGAIIATIVIAVYKSGLSDLKERLREQDQSMDAIRAALFDDGKIVREMMHDFDKRIERVEWGRRKSDSPSADGDD